MLAPVEPSLDRISASLPAAGIQRHYSIGRRRPQPKYIYHEDTEDTEFFFFSPSVISVAPWFIILPAGRRRLPLNTAEA